MELSEALNNRKSTRHYIDKKVDKSLLDEMLSAANLLLRGRTRRRRAFMLQQARKVRMP